MTAIYVAVVLVVVALEVDVDLDVRGVTGGLASNGQGAEFFGRMVETADE